MAFKLRITSTAFFLKKSDSSTAPINWLFLQRYTAVVSSSDTMKFHKLFILCCINGDNNVQRGQ